MQGAEPFNRAVCPDVHTTSGPNEGAVSASQSLGELTASCKALPGVFDGDLCVLEQVSVCFQEHASTDISVLHAYRHIWQETVQKHH